MSEYRPVVKTGEDDFNEFGSDLKVTLDLIMYLKIKQSNLISSFLLVWNTF